MKRFNKNHHDRGYVGTIQDSERYTRFREGLYDEKQELEQDMDGGLHDGSPPQKSELQRPVALCMKPPALREAAAALI